MQGEFRIQSSYTETVLTSSNAKELKDSEFIQVEKPYQVVVVSADDTVEKLRLWLLEIEDTLKATWDWID